MSISFAFVFSVLVLVAGFAQGQTYKILLSFNWTNGGNPDATPFLDAAGNLYGTDPTAVNMATAWCTNWTRPAR
jgi:hypothetical protein